ncbi:hypothetical protein XENTR_v10001856 [Xenopus tropicalis]|nr:hypothetical protein XENTR_v10001856 [Xenopus tropicalis]
MDSWKVILCRTVYITLMLPGSWKSIFFSIGSCLTFLSQLSSSFPFHLSTSLASVIIIYSMRVILFPGRADLIFPWAVLFISTNHGTSAFAEPTALISDWPSYLFYIKTNYKAKYISSNNHFARKP